MRRPTPNRIRKMRKSLGMSKMEFGHILWAAVTTVDQWETGECIPVGAHRRLLLLLEEALADPKFKPIVLGARANDPLFLLYRLLKPLYANRSVHSV
jgi:hypothetical protein